MISRSPTFGRLPFQHGRNRHHFRLTAPRDAQNRRRPILSRSCRTSSRRASTKESRPENSSSLGSGSQQSWAKRITRQTPAKALLIGLTAYLSFEVAQGQYIGYYKARDWHYQNLYGRLPLAGDKEHDNDSSETLPSDGADVSIVAPDGSYKPLTGSRPIRLLRLLPGEGDAQLKMGLWHVDLANSNPSFEALSYVWGSEQVPDGIMLDGQTRPAGKNLCAALHRLRHAQKARTLWVDAVCINQQDDVEKTQQVQLMREIYSRAQYVLIWLSDDEAIENGIQKLRKREPDEKHIDWSPLKGLFTNPWFYMGQSVLIWLGFRTASQAGVQRLQPHQYSKDFDWASLIPIFQSTWFERVWCIQELVVAKFPVIVTKDSYMTWKSFAEAMTEMRTGLQVYSMNTKAVGGMKPDVKGMHNVFFLMEMREKYRLKRRERHTLLELLFLTRAHKATDPRDKLFALVGLAADVLASDWEVLPDYSIPVDEVYRRFALWYLTRKRNLEIFSFGRSLENCPNSSSSELDSLPSWVPDLTNPDLASPLPKLAYLSNNYIDPRYELAKEFELRRKHFGEAVKMYHADLRWPWWAFGYRAGFKPAGIAVKDGGTVVEVVGVQIGTLKTTGAPTSVDVEASPLQAYRQTYDWMCEAWTLIASHTGHNAHEWLPKTLIDSSWRTMTCCMNPTGHNAQATIYSRATDTVYEVYLSDQKALKHMEEGATAVGSSAHRQNREELREALVFHIMSHEATLKDFLLLDLSIRRWLNHRRFGITDTGLFAAVPAGAREGDIICVLNGGRVPYVLRRSGEWHKFTLVGECYVDEMMRGEAQVRSPAKQCERRFAIH